MSDIFTSIFSPEGLASLATLTVLEIVLGIDNVIFVSIVASRLPKEKQSWGRRLGLVVALALRVALLSTLVWLSGLTKPIFAIFGHDFSARDVILILGGLYLLYKAGQEIDEMVRPKPSQHKNSKSEAQAAFMMVVVQIGVVDLIFAIDSIVTAVGMTNQLPIMITAVVIAIIVMMFATEWISAFIDKHPTTKMLALTFLFLVGAVLVVDGLGLHIERTYLYVAIAFSLAVEFLNIWAKKAMDVLDGPENDDVAQNGEKD